MNVHDVSQAGFWRGCALGAAMLLPLAAAAADIHDLGGKGQGNTPVGPIVMDAAGNVYGAAAAGGTFGYGTVFEMTHQPHQAWTYTDIYSFQGGADGAEPIGVTIDSAGNLYGVTYSYSTGTPATLFKLAPPAAGQPSWTKTILTTLQNTMMPSSGPLRASDGTIYGTLSASGTSFGAVYAAAPPAAGGTGPYTFNILYNFPSLQSGFDPIGQLVMDSKGDLIGATEYGGEPGCTDNCGTIFRLQPPANGHTRWGIRLLYEFPSDTPGNPVGGVIIGQGGVLYGTATLPNAYSGGSVFTLTSQGQGPYALKTIYTFSGGDPGEPEQLVRDKQGNLYGISYRGGNNVCKIEPCGTIFGLSPPSPGSTTWTENFVIDGQTTTGAYPTGLALGSGGELFETLYADGAHKGGAINKYPTSPN